MLSKLFKHEFKAMARLLLPLYLVLLVLTIMDRIVLNLDIFTGTLKMIPGLITFAYIISIGAILIVSGILIITRFYKNLMTDEGYLMFTLPVKSHQLINSKLIASILWFTASTIVAILSLLIVFLGVENFNEIWNAIKMVFAEIKIEFKEYTALFIIELILMVILSIINNILEIYASIAIGQLFNGHKVIGSFGAYVGITTIIQIVVTACIFFIGVVFKTNIDEMSSLVTIVFPLTLLFLVVTNVVFYLVTDYIFKRKINL